MWTCPKCGEAIEDQFDACWKCAGPAEPGAPSEGWSLQAKICCGLGVAFELLLILLCAVLPRDSWLWVKCFNFLHASRQRARCSRVVSSPAATVFQTSVIVALRYARPAFRIVSARPTASCT